jgi:hypothetical protein
MTTLKPPLSFVVFIFFQMRGPALPGRVLCKMKKAIKPCNRICHHRAWYYLVEEVKLQMGIFIFYLQAMRLFFAAGSKEGQ